MNLPPTITLHLTPAADAFVARPASALTPELTEYLRRNRDALLADILRHHWTEAEVFAGADVPQSFWDALWPPVDAERAAAACRALCDADLRMEVQ